MSPEKLSANRASSESACTTRIAPIASDAVEAIAPSRLRCLRETDWMRLLSRSVGSQNSGATASTMRASCQWSQNISPAIATRISTFASSGMSAVTATSLSIPMSLITRTTRSPLRALVWNDSERRCRWRYRSARTDVSTRLPTSAKPTVLR